MFRPAFADATLGANREEAFMEMQAVPLEDTITAVYCAIDDALADAGIVARNGKLTHRPGPAPELDDREVLCLSVLQELLDFESDNSYFHWLENKPLIRSLFPQLIQRQKFADRRALLSTLMESLCGAFCNLAGEGHPLFSPSIRIPSRSAGRSAPAKKNASAAWPKQATAPRRKCTSTACASI